MNNSKSRNQLVGEIEQKLAGISQCPHLDALFFVQACVRQKKEITPSLVADFVARIKKNEPVSKIVGERGFWALDFKVSTDVLDPRPDSETIIEGVYLTLKKNQLLLIF